MINSINFIKSYEKKNEGRIAAISKEYTGVPIDDKYFTKIASRKSAEMFGVDGGSAVIADGGGWIIAFIRISAIGYDGYKKVFSQKKEYTLTVVHSEMFNMLLEDEAGSLDMELPDVSNEEIEDIPAVIMKFLEWKTCLELCRQKKRLIVMDASLESDNELEKRVIAKAIQLGLTYFE